MFARLRPWILIGTAFLGVLMIVGEVQAKHLGLNGKEDFAEIARRGFFETMHTTGLFTPVNPYNPPTAPDYIGRQRNSYAWSSAWFKGKYYVGTARNVLCYLSPADPPDPLCSPVDQPGLNDRGEIWEYNPGTEAIPAGPGGTRGSWVMRLQSPCIVAGGGIFLTACQGYPTLGVTANLPRDIGYRGMMVSNQNGTDLPLDPTQRLWVNTFGMGGRILQSTNGTTYNVASLNGLATIPSITTITGLTALQNVATVDLGYRSILIWKGRVCIAPVGSLADVDLAVNPTVLCNSNPASTSSTWQTIVNVKTQPVLGDPNNLGIFQMGVFNGDLYIGVTNRTTGVQVWKLPESACPTPFTSGITCVANSPLWERIITQGGGRLLDSDGLPSSAGVSDMKVYDNGTTGAALYIGTSESAAFNNSAAELFRVNQTGPGQPITWDLIMGRPRVKSLMDSMNTDPTLAADFNCSTPNATTGTQFAFGAPTGTVNACFPLSDMNAGFGGGASATSPFTGGFSGGNQSYIWRMAVHDDLSGTGPYLYGGTLDLNNGFDLMKSKDGVTWKTAGIANAIVNNGLDNSNNYGVRTLVSVPNWPGGAADGVSPGPALLVGTANPYTEDGPPPAETGGAEVHVGTCAPTSVPTAVAAVTTKSSAPGQVIFDATIPRYVAFDDENFPSPPGTGAAGDSSVAVTLVGSASYGTFCGDLISYQWYDKLGNFTGLGANSAIAGASGNTIGPNGKLTINTHAITPLATGSDTTGYTFTLCVTDNATVPVTDCEDVNVTASHNLPPTAAIAAVPAPISGCGGGGGGGGGNSRVCLVDLGTTGSETFTAQGTCTDPEYPGAFPASLASCTWSADSGVTFGSPLSSTGGSDGDPDSAGTAYTVAALVGDGNIFLTATDDHGYVVQARTRVRVIAPVHDVAVTAIAQPEVVPATVGVAQNVNVTVRNNGHFAETFNVTLADANGGTGGVLPVTLAACVTTLSANSHTQLSPCPSQVLVFSWTPTSASVHTLTATAATPAGVTESNTQNNVGSTTVEVDPGPHALTINSGPSGSLNPVASGGTANLSVSAIDSHGHALAYAWSVISCTWGTATGSFNNTTFQNPIWTAPSNTTGIQQSCTIRVDVNDGAGGGDPKSAFGEYAQNVSPLLHTLTINSGPSGSPNPVASGGIANLSVTATDSYGHARSYLWSASCPTLPSAGSFGSPTSASTTWTAPANTTGSLKNCTITANVNDGTGDGDPKSASPSYTQGVSSGSSFAAPTGVTATLTGTFHQVRLVWIDNATTETRYEVQRCNVSSCLYGTLTTSLSANTTSINNTVPSAGTYRYRVRACKSTGCTAYGVSNNILVP